MSFFRITSHLRKTKDHLIFKSKFETLHTTLIEKLNNSNEMYQNLYKDKVSVLSNSANDILLSWQKIDINVNSISSYIDKKHLKEYRSEIKKIFKDLHNISRKLNKRGLVTNTI